MKKTIAALFAIASAAVFAGANDLLITFSTPGPDKYADGKDVLKGESYALVWTGADGTQKTVLTFPTLEAKHCTPVLFVIDEKDVGKYSGGTWGVYLLDTRDYAKDATGATLADREDGQPKVVNVKAKVTKESVGATMASAVVTSGVAADAYDIPAPVVTGIKVDGANVYVTVRNIVPCLEYTLQSGSDAKNFAVPQGVKKDASSTIEQITLTVPKQDGAQFFRVTTK